MKITVVGLGYVGLTMATLLSTKYSVTGYDINYDLISKINRKEAPIDDEEIIEFLQTKTLQLECTNDKKEAFQEADYIVIAAPTDYNIETNRFDTSTIDVIIHEALLLNQSACFVIKSTVPIGYTESLREKFDYDRIFFSPEFLREGKALYDNLYPSRIIVGSKDTYAVEFAEMLREVSYRPDTPIMTMGSKEAESVKLFANTYLALRIGFFNEIDTYCELEKLNSFEVIKGISLDPRIGDYYNNPSFGYGGYCLPKDTMQTLSNFAQIDNATIKASVRSNQKRFKHIVDMVMEKKPKSVGIYRLNMKSGSDNIRSSAMLSIMKMLKQWNIDIVIYEPLIVSNQFDGTLVLNDLNQFIESSDLILANRMTDDMNAFRHKVYTRDLFNNN